MWSERGWKKSRFGKKGSLRVTTGGSCLWDKQLKGCTERFEMSGLTSQTTIHLQARMYRQRVRGPETPEPLQHDFFHHKVFVSVRVLNYFKTKCNSMTILSHGLYYLVSSWQPKFLSFADLQLWCNTYSAANASVFLFWASL